MVSRVYWLFQVLVVLSVSSNSKSMPSIDRDPMENKMQQSNVQVEVASSDTPAPYFIKTPMAPIVLNETFDDFNQVIAEFEAASNIDDDNNVILKISRGNVNHKFVLEQINSTAYIKLGGLLDYEQVTRYELTIQATNAYEKQTEALLMINVLDENDNVPEILGEKTGTVMEHEPPGTFVMQVHAQDHDGTTANNIVSFRIVGPSKQYFHIDNQSGIVTSSVVFDRNTEDVYRVTVIAEDNAPSVLSNNGKPNSVTQQLIVRIMDVNYQKPQFEKPSYKMSFIPENAAINTPVIQVQAYDQCKESTMKYSIIKNNVAKAFRIDENTGQISVNNTLDYESIPEYKLFVMADNGHFNTTVRVLIAIGNINDNSPKFHELENVTIAEETIPVGCITRVMAYDPDIENFEIPQAIRYTLTKEHAHLLDIDDSGCLRLLQPLDRDPPNGSKLLQINLTATDENGNGKSTTVPLIITLEDINDNAPYLTNKMHVVWSENRSPGMIIKLIAEDVDEEHNGPPFFYSIDPEASWEIKQRFKVVGDELHASVEFDREEQKVYRVPILIRDSGDQPMSAISTLVIEIGDENDNEMQCGVKQVVVQKLYGNLPDLNVGRVYVSDLDDWDIADKSFIWYNNSTEDEHFKLNTNNGMITMLEGTPSGQHDLRFRVFERSNHFPRHNVSAQVKVIVKEISERAIDQSGSIRFYNVTAHEFLSNTPGRLSSPFERLQKGIATILNISTNDVNIFTINNRRLAHGTFLDVFYVVYSATYLASEVLNGAVSLRWDHLEREVGFPIDKIGIDECEANPNMCEQLCRNKVYRSSKPIVVNTNVTSFVGITAFVQADCITETLSCTNGGTLENNKCVCPKGYNGARCEMLDISFDGSGYAIYSSDHSDHITNISIEISPRQTIGLILYIGPLSYNPRVSSQPFLALEMIDGRLILLLDDGSKVPPIEDQHKFSQNDSLTISITLQPQMVMMNTVVNKLSASKTRYTYKYFKGVLNFNGMIHLGGSAIDLTQLGSLYNWTNIPQARGFNGSIRNLTINGRTIDFQQPNLGKNVALGHTLNISQSCISHWFYFVFFVIVVVVFWRKKSMYNICFVAHPSEESCLSSETNGLQPFLSVV